MIPPLFQRHRAPMWCSKGPGVSFGRQLDVIVPMSFLCDGYGLQRDAGRYTDKVVLGFLGCRDTLPHLQRLAQYRRAAFEGSETAALPLTKRRQRPSPAVPPNHHGVAAQEQPASRSIGDPRLMLAIAHQ